MLILRFSALGVPAPLPAGEVSSAVSYRPPSQLDDISFDEDEGDSPEPACAPNSLDCSFFAVDMVRNATG